MGGSKSKEMTASRWSTDLPTELLECIADRLGLIELLSFRGVCKNWNSATSAASARIESQPWFLIYGGDGENQPDSKCRGTLFADSGRKYSSSLPEMEGATCLASNQGWLLLYRRSSIYLFNPISRAVLHLPAPLPPSLISHVHTAAAHFSSPPTSPACAVCVIVRSGVRRWTVYQIRRGADTWTERELPGYPGKFVYAGYHNGIFYFADDRYGLYRVAEDGGIGWWDLNFTKMTEDDDNDDDGTDSIISSTSYVDAMNERLGLNDVNEEFKLISICGIEVSLNRERVWLPYQEIDDDDESSDPDSRPRRRGVWLLPRFDRIDPRKTW